jgi:ribosomal protein L29
MKVKDKQKLHQLTVSELLKELIQVQKELVESRLKTTIAKQKDLHTTQKKRQQIAIIKTIIKSKQQE